VEQIESYGQMFDMVQIPAFLSRQTSLLEAAAQTGSVIHVKKMQSAPPNDVYMFVNVLKNAGAERVIATDRGTAFGYNQLIFDPRHIPMMKLHADEVLVDITHMNKYHSRWYWENMDFPGVLAKSSMAAGADGLFMEVHSNPKEALCDAQSQLTMEQFKKIITLI
jgi:2-dehydro-3-deoxyphosphooctonate aldolase (KDO 8-P synthase)